MFVRTSIAMVGLAAFACDDGGCPRGASMRGGVCVAAAGDAGAEDRPPGAGTGTATLTGRVVRLSGEGLGGARVRLGDATALTSRGGTFQLFGVESGMLEVDPAPIDGASFASFSHRETLGAGEQRELERAIVLPEIAPTFDVAGALEQSPLGTSSLRAAELLSITPPGLPGLLLSFSAGIDLSWPGGAEAGWMSVTSIDPDRGFDGRPTGASWSIALEPAGLTLGAGEVGAGFALRQWFGLPDGTALVLRRYDPETGRMEGVGTARVTTDTDGLSRIRTNGTPITRFGRYDLACAGTVRGTVRGSDGNAVPGLVVHLVPGVLRGTRDEVAFDSTPVVATTGANGDFELDTAPACVYRARVFEPTRAGLVLLHESAPVAALPGRDLAIALKPEASARLGQTTDPSALKRSGACWASSVSVKLTVTDPGGAPWPGQSVTFEGVGWSMLQKKTTDAQGVARAIDYYVPGNLGTVKVTPSSPCLAATSVSTNKCEVKELTIKATTSGTSPTLTAVAPSGVVTNRDATLTLTGQRLSGTAKVAFAGESITPSTLACTSQDNTLTVKITKDQLTKAAANGATSAKIKITNPDGTQTNEIDLGLGAPAPTILSVDPGSFTKKPGAIFSTTVTGTQFQNPDSMVAVVGNRCFPAKGDGATSTTLKFDFSSDLLEAGTPSVWLIVADGCSEALGTSPTSNSIDVSVAAPVPRVDLSGRDSNQRQRWEVSFNGSCRGLPCSAYLAHVQDANPTTKLVINYFHIYPTDPGFLEWTGQLGLFLTRSDADDLDLWGQTVQGFLYNEPPGGGFSTEYIEIIFPQKPDPCAGIRCSGDECHPAGTCIDGTCTTPPVRPDGTMCGAYSSCTANGCTDVPLSCTAGECVDASPVPPSVGECESARGHSVSGPPMVPDSTIDWDVLALPDGTVCSGGSCKYGRCIHPDDCETKGCSAPSDPTCQLSEGTCDRATGKCTYQNRPEGTTCDDGNPCSLGDVCRTGACRSGGTKDCPAPDACHDVGTCDPATGACVNPRFSWCAESP